MTSEVIVPCKNYAKECLLNRTGILFLLPVTDKQHKLMQNKDGLRVA